MQDDQLIIEELGIESWPADKKQATVEEATIRIGNAITDSLSEQQYEEYKAIVDDNEEVINAWLERNIPDYETNSVYEEIVAGYEADPEKNNPRKIFANLAWMQLNVPNIQEVVAKALADFKQELATRS